MQDFYRTYLSMAATPDVLRQFFLRSLGQSTLRAMNDRTFSFDPLELEYLANLLASSAPWTTSQEIAPAQKEMKAVWDFRGLDEAYLAFLAILERINSPYVAERFASQLLLQLGLIHCDVTAWFGRRIRRRKRNLNDFFAAGVLLYNIAANPRYRNAKEITVMHGMAAHFPTWVNVLAHLRENEIADRNLVGVHPLAC